MEQDEQLKQILFNSAEGASAGFADAVMKKVNALSGAGLCYPPLVSSRLKRLFLLVFGTVAGAILVLCGVIAFTQTDVVSWVQNITVPEVSYQKIAVFIITFWLVFTVNAFIEKKYLLRRPASF